jgi:hypothetical protein
MSGHLALLGDSILDNGQYTSGGPAVITQVGAMLPEGWQASLLAINGSLVDELPAQLSRLPDDVSHLVISIGGNDVIGQMALLYTPVRSAAEALLKLRESVVAFEHAYRRSIGKACVAERRVILCTIYNGNLPERLNDGSFPDPAAARMGLSAFNDVILRVAFELKLDVIDLRLVCTEPADYANPIEPSSRGGEKIARAIVRCLGLEPGASPPTRVFY